MDREQVKNLILGLSRSKGFYGRLYEALEETSEEERELFYNQFKDCKNELEVIIKIEE